MIAAGPHRSGDQKDAHIQGWLVSVFLHGTVALAAILFVKQVPLASQDEAFKWNVAMVSAAQPVQPTASPRNKPPAPFAPPTTSVPSHHGQQTVPAQMPPTPQSVAQETTPSISNQGITSTLAEVHPLPTTTPSHSEARTTQSAEPTTHEIATSMVAEATSNVRSDEAQMAASAESTSHTPPSNAPLAIEQIAPTDQVPAPTQVAAIYPAPTSAPTKRDYGWLSEAILRRVEELKRYPVSARADRAEGKVVVKAVINEDGSVGEVAVLQSSGHPSLDKAAIETLQQAAPFHLPHPLGQPGMTIKIPMSYRLDR